MLPRQKVSRRKCTQKNKITLPEDKLETFMKMLDKLDENDDVQNVYHNVELPEEEEED